MNETQTIQATEILAEEGETVEDKLRVELLWEGYHEAILEETCPFGKRA